MAARNSKVKDNFARLGAIFEPTVEFEAGDDASPALKARIHQPTGPNHKAPAEPNSKRASKKVAERRARAVAAMFASPPTPR